MAFSFPSPVYPIVDPGDRGLESCVELAGAFLAAGCRFFQLRVKGRSTRDLVAAARAVKELSDRHGADLIVNDRADVARLVGAAGVHLGQDDLPPAAAREILGAGKVIGFSTHNLDQLDEASRDGVADYLAFGPIFPTRSKQNPDPVQGCTRLREARSRTSRPLVAIGGIDAGNLAEVLAAGADAVALIGALRRGPDPRAALADLMRRAAAVTPLRDPPRS